MDLTLWCSLRIPIELRTNPKVYLIQKTMFARHSQYRDLKKRIVICLGYDGVLPYDSSLLLLDVIPLQRNKMPSFTLLLPISFNGLLSK